MQKFLESVAVFGAIDGIGRGAQNRNAGFFESVCQIQGRLSAELDDHALQIAFGLFNSDDFQNVFRAQRLEIEPVGCVIIG